MRREHDEKWEYDQKRYMTRNMYSAHKKYKSHFQFHVTTKSDLPNQSAPHSKWLVQFDVHKLTLQINKDARREKKPPPKKTQRERERESCGIVLLNSTSKISVSKMHETK